MSQTRTLIYISNPGGILIPCIYSTTRPTVDLQILPIVHYPTNLSSRNRKSQLDGYAAALVCLLLLVHCFLPADEGERKTGLHRTELLGVMK
jgi:hypothetical protein